jgi:hypothetical protein
MPVAGELVLAAPSSFAYWEGEDARETNFPAETAFSASKLGAAANLLSGGRWLCNDRAPASGPLRATYDVRVPKSARYRFWVRKFWKHGPFRWRFDALPHASCTRDAPLEQRTSLRDRIEASWVYLGAVELAEGSHAFEIELADDAAPSWAACFDAFLLSSDDQLLPSGQGPPRKRAFTAGPGTWFPVAFYEDAFAPESVIDMCHLLDKPAGQHGFLHRSGEALRFERAAAPIKFWGAGANAAGTSDEAHARRARYLCKHGINMVRQHPLQSQLGLLRADGTFEPAALDAWDRWFAALERQGIYVTVSMFYPHRIRRDEGYDLFDELEGEGDERVVGGLVAIEPALQESEWRWARALLTHRNPHTGMRYVDDPALAVVEIHNEDSVFFHTPLNALAEGRYPRHLARLQRRWAAWLKARYRNDAALRRAWGEGLFGPGTFGSGMRRGDSLANRAMPIYAAWEMTADGPKDRPRERRRMGDFIRFLAELQRDYYARRVAQLRELGYRGVIISTAWRAGGPAADPANLWTDTAADMISRHGYVGGGAGQHDIALGAVDLETHLARPGSGLLSLGFYQVEGRPFGMTEWTAMPPNPWKAEAAPLIAFYGLGLQGWDASYHFESFLDRLGNGWPGARKYVTDTPQYMAQFPALAFAVHRGHLREGATVAARRRDHHALFQGVDALGQDFESAEGDRKELHDDSSTPAEWLAIGKVTVAFTGGGDERADVSRLWDRSRKTIRANTGELEWDYGRQLVSVRSAKTQGIIGRAAGGRAVSLPAVTLDVDTPFVSLLLTPLDDQPLLRSRRVLVTALARERPTGARFSPDGSRLLDAGGPPLLMEPVQATIRFAGGAPSVVRVLDVHGVPTGRQVPLASDGSFRIDGRYATYYYEVVR